jgi:hypothetical protein
MEESSNPKYVGISWNCFYVAYNDYKPARGARKDRKQLSQDLDDVMPLSVVTIRLTMGL